ncbi:MAG: 4Fe-4S dicluster domain-containing protein [Deltaproteobacteria bacterium]|nr:4Fe-4S dicluster domain-containing protein [Deltaproteobacteria bacterium]
MSTNEYKKHWGSIEEFEVVAGVNTQTEINASDNSRKITKENESISRRDFLKASGFSLVAASLTLSGCKNAINKAIPYLIKPESITPGVSTFYASTFFDGHDYCSILVKTTEGRPIKIEGNTLSRVSTGGTNAKVQASVLSLYDDFRIKSPLKAKQKTTWDTVDAEIISKLEELTKKGNKIVILTSSIISPSTKNVFKDFLKKYPTTEVISYDAISSSGMIEANKMTFGKEVLPTYKFNRADLIVSFGADFLGTWIAPIEFTKQYASRRTPRSKTGKANAGISKHVQFESTLSLTGSNADYRIPINPSEEGPVLLEIYNKLATRAGKKPVAVSDSKVANSQIDAGTLPDELWAKKGRALVVSGSNDVHIQILVNKINSLIGSYGATIDLGNPTYYRQGIDGKMAELIERLEKGEVKGMILYHVNPAYDYPQADRFINALAKTTLSVSFSETMDETASLVNYICPDNHFLESWNDAEPRKGSFSLGQPTIGKLFDTRQAQESLLKWTGLTGSQGGEATEGESAYYLYIKKYWEKALYPLQSGHHSFASFWTAALQNGVYEPPAAHSKSPHTFLLSDHEFSKTVSSVLSEKTEGFEYSLYESIGIGTGRHANNPWLQELPDPVSKVCWDNYLAVSYGTAKKLNLKLGDNVKINDLFELPVLIQPGQSDHTVSIALGYGRTHAGKVADHVGKNAYKLVSLQKRKNGIQRIYSGGGITFKPTGRNYIFALTQTHHTMEGRNHVRRGRLSEYAKNPYTGNEQRIEDLKHKVSLYKARVFEGHHWGLAVDLSRCTGCSACVIACTAENNVPVVGRDEVRQKRIMHWLRVDRYYSEQPVRPEVYFQPVMCMQCNHAPCENVCPVGATQNSKEGLNEMAYNRCVGTRYCMNNCPYHVRRFNWLAYSNNNKFDYNTNSELGKMVLNPDVVVRSRGVVEKCTFCVQRIQESKLVAKTENRELLDGEIKTACVQACPAGAMVFGDLNKKDSAVSKAFLDERNYFLLEELHTVPAVGYLTKIKNDEPLAKS